MRSPLVAPEFFSPLSLAAVALLGLNDHVFKAQFGNALTGKLSDIAGCFVLPLFLSALLALFTRVPLRERLGASAAFTFLFFTAIKSSQAAADLTADALTAIGTGGGRIIADPTDLIALPFILFAVWYGHGRYGAVSPPSASPGVIT